MLNIAHVHHDPKLWGDPENFRPERFLTENRTLIKPDYLIPFGLGITLEMKFRSAELIFKVKFIREETVLGRNFGQEQPVSDVYHFAAKIFARGA